jgi:transcriptional regulator with XRE-family HTH domain
MDAIDEKNTRFGELRRAFGSRETQAKFAERIGLDRTLVSKIETGSLSLTQKTIRILCEKIHVNEEWLRTGKGEMFIEIKDSAFTKTPEELDLLLTFRKLTVEMQKTFLTLEKTLLEQ